MAGSKLKCEPVFDLIADNIKNVSHGYLLFVFYPAWLLKIKKSWLELRSLCPKFYLKIGQFFVEREYNMLMSCTTSTMP